MQGEGKSRRSAFWGSFPPTRLAVVVQFPSWPMETAFRLAQQRICKPIANGLNDKLAGQCVEFTNDTLTGEAQRRIIYAAVACRGPRSFWTAGAGTCWKFPLSVTRPSHCTQRRPSTKSLG